MDARRFRRSRLKTDEIGVVEAVVQEGSSLVGASALAVAPATALPCEPPRHPPRCGRGIAQRLRRVRFRPGDVIVLQGSLEDNASELGGSRLPAAGAAQHPPRGACDGRHCPFPILAIAMGLVAFQLVPVSIAFFGAATLIVLAGALTLPRDLRQYPMADHRPDCRAPAAQRGSAAGRAVRCDRRCARHLAGGLPPIGALAMTIIVAHGGNALFEQRRDGAGHRPRGRSVLPASLGSALTRF